MNEIACLNGRLMPADEAKVPIWDRGFLFGDSVYEVMRVYQGRCWLEREHLDRLARSLRAIEIEGFDPASLRDRVSQTLLAAGVSEGTVYIQITRGAAPRRHAYPSPPVVPTELIVVRPYDDASTAVLRDTGVGVITLPDLRWGRRDIKSTNLLANVMANDAAHRQGSYEAVLFDSAGVVTEATHSSVLWVRDGVLQGSPEGSTILPGTSRRLVLKLIEIEAIAFEEAEISLDEFRESDEVMLTGTTIEVLPVVTIDSAPAGTGSPGPITRRLQSAFKAELETWLRTREKGQ